MAQVPRSSFIPKQVPGTSSSVRRRRRFHVFRTVSIAIFLGSLVLTGGAFLYKDYTLSQLEEQKTALANERSRFNEDDIASVRAFDRRLRAAAFLLDNHVAPSKIFDALELSTLQRVQFIEFQFRQRPSQEVTMTVHGGTEEFKTVALQSLQFGDDPLLGKVAFTELGTTDTGVVTGEPGSPEETAQTNQHSVNFTVVGNLTASALMYEGVQNVPNVESSSEASTATGTPESEESGDFEEGDAALSDGEEESTTEDEDVAPDEAVDT